MSDWTFGDPKSGDQFKAKEHVGRLVAFVDPSRKEVETEYGVDEATPCRFIVILDGDDAGTVLEDSLVFGNISKDAYANGSEKIVLGRVSQGKAKPGKSAPYILEPAEDSDKAAAAAWFNKHASLDSKGQVLIKSD